LHETNGWENFIQYEIIVDVSNPFKNSLVNIVNDVEKYDLGFENHVLTKCKYMKNWKTFIMYLNNMTSTFHMNNFMYKWKN
jgi:hypothetical protein